jgi:hypothetical protein
MRGKRMQTSVKPEAAQSSLPAAIAREDERDFARY